MFALLDNTLRVEIKIEIGIEVNFLYLTQEIAGCHCIVLVRFYEKALDSVQSMREIIDHRIVSLRFYEKAWTVMEFVQSM